MATPFSKQCDILGEFWVYFKNDEEFANFFNYNDFGPALAYFISQGLVSGQTEEAENFVTESFEILTSVNLEREYDTLQDVFDEYTKHEELNKENS